MTRVGPLFVLSLIDSVRLESFTFAKSLVRSGLSILLLDASYLDFPLLVRAISHPSLSLSTSGIVWPGLMLPVSDHKCLELLSSVQSFSHLSSSLFVIDFSCLELPLFLQGSGHLGFLLFLVGLTRVGFVFGLLVADMSQLEPAVFLRSFSYLSFAIPPIDYSTIGLSIFTHSFACVECSLPAIGKAQMDLPLFASDFPCLELLIFLRSFGHLGSGSLLFDCSHLGLAVSLRHVLQLEELLLIFSMSRLEPILLMLDMTLGSSVSPRAFVHPDSLVLISSFAELGLLVFSQSFACTGSPSLLFELSHLGSFAFLKSCAQTDLALSLEGLACLEFVFALLVTENTPMGFFLFPRAFARLELSFSHLDFSNMALAPFLRNFACPAFPPLVPGAGCLGSCPSVLGAGSMGFSISPQSLACLSLATFVLGSCDLGLLPPIKQLVCSDSSMPLIGPCSSGYTTRLSVLGAVNLGPSFSLRSFCRLALFLLLFNEAYTGLSLFLKSLCHPAFMLSVVGLTRIGLLTSMCEVTHTDPLASAHSLV